MQLQRLADEDEAEHAVDVEGAAELAFGVAGVVEVAARGFRFDAFEEALDQAAGLVLFGEAEAVAGDGLGDVEGLEVVAVIGAFEEALVELLLGRLHEALPDGVAVLGGAEGEQAERGVGEAVFVFLVGEGLGGDAAGGEVDEVEIPYLGLVGRPVVLANGQRGVARFVGAAAFVGEGSDRPLLGHGFQVMAQNRLGHVEALVCKVFHSL